MHSHDISRFADVSFGLQLSSRVDPRFNQNIAVCFDVSNIVSEAAINVQFPGLGFLDPVWTVPIAVEPNRSRLAQQALDNLPECLALL